MPSFRPNVALLLLDSKNRLLARERYHIADTWQVPQGGVAAGEAVLEALHREVKEEIGLPPSAYEIVEMREGYRYLYPEHVKKKKKGNYDGQEQTYFLCRLKRDAPPIDIGRKPREFRAYRWLAPVKFQLEWLPNFKRSVYRQVMRDFFDVKLEAS
jgi:putative (di)nucleoside polyphosphate hydrolase